MTLTEFRYVVAVARELHFGRAAQACFVSQPTLSVAIRKLEEELGVVLFERSQNDISITPIGIRIVDQARKILAETETLKHLAQLGQDPFKEPLRLGVIHTIGPYLLPHVVPALHRKAPTLPLHIEESMTAPLSELLKTGELDVVLLSLPFDEPGITVAPLYDEPFQVVMPKGHALEAKQFIDVHDLAHETALLLGVGHCFRDQILDFCPELNRRQGFSTDARKVLQGGSLETIRLMVASGAGISVFPCTALSAPNHHHKLLSVRPFSDPVPMRRVALAWRRSSPRQQVFQLLAEIIKLWASPCINMVTDTTSNSP